MTLSLAPSVRYMIVCDEVVKDSQRPGKLTIVGLTSLINWPPEETGPLRLERLVVLLILTNGRGKGTVRIVCHNEETGLVEFGTPPRPISFEGTDPVGHHGITFKVLDCHFRGRGVYNVQFFYDNTILHEQLITVR